MPPPKFDQIEINIGATVRILFYGDHPDTNVAPVPQPGPGARLRGSNTEFGLRILKDTLEAQSSILLRFRVDVLLRNHHFKPDGFPQTPAVPGANKLTPALLAKYDQVWFFGQHYANFTQYDDNYGGPQSELTDPEVAALRAWMDAGGGVLVTGDHSNDVSYFAQNLADQSLRGKTLNLGRALGARVPRAGEMRVWVGAPDASPPSYYVDTAGDSDMGGMPKQEDAIPQSIRVARVWRKVSFVATNAPFKVTGFWYEDDHSLFKTAPNADFPSSRIDILPDHVHEGAVAIPRTFDPGIWPKRGNYQPQPSIVAWGTNKAPLRFRIGGGLGATAGIFSSFREVGAVAAYDGDAAGVGRILAHATWHHHVNVNLIGFRNPDGSPGKVLNRLGEYYRNCAVWLSPSVKRWSVWSASIAWAARNPSLREMAGAPTSALGAAATSVLGEALGAGVMADLAELPFAAIAPEPNAAGPAVPGELLLGMSVADVQRQLALTPRAPVNGTKLLIESARAAVTAQHHALVRDASALEGWLYALPGAAGIPREVASTAKLAPKAGKRRARLA